MTYHDIRFDQGAARDRNGLAARVLGGEVFVVRGALQAFGLMDMMVEASLRGITKSVGAEAAARAQREGFNHIHEWVSPGDIPKMTDAVYDEVEPLAPEFLRRFMGGAFPDVTSFYYEQKPNVRFHIPYDLARAHQAAFKDFAKQHGQGKIAAHGPHRDSWLDCPSNGMNLWFAIGRIRPGNGMTVYPKDYQGSHAYQRSGDIADGEKLHGTWTFDLNPGDVILFHTDHVHGSELNRTRETRFAISYRLSVDKPVFPNLHHHSYIHSGWNDSVLKPLAHIPAMAQPSYARSFAERVRNRLFPTLRPGEAAPKPPETIGTKVGEMIEVPLADVPVGEIRGLTAALCVARLSETEVVALTRRCPHAGGDIANGWVDGDTVVCPWHNLPFDTASGRSPCGTLPALRRVACEIRGDRIVVDPKSVLNEEPAVDAAE